MSPIPYPIPYPGVVDATGPFLPIGYVQLVVLICIASVLVAYAILFSSTRSVRRRRERLFCPVRLRMARVLFRLAPDGSRADVIRCSVFGRRPITCGKSCMNAPARD